MADHTLNNVRITQKNDTKTNWSTKNPVLLKGEVGIEFDPSASDNSYVVKFKIGDGTNHWNDLTYFGGEVTLPAPDGTSIVDDNNVWSIAGFSAANAGTFPVKRVTNNVDEIEWVTLPSHIADLDDMYTKLSGIASGAEVNQNAFSNVKVGSTTIAADSKTDTLEIVGGDNVTITPDATNDKITIAATDTTYESKEASSGGTAVSLVTTGEKYTWNNKQDSLSDMTSSELTTGTATTSRSVRADYLKTGVNTLIDTKIGSLDVTGASNISAGKTISAWSETDGKVSISTQDISITKSQVSDFPTMPTHLDDIDDMYTKLDGIEAGAQVNTVTSVAGKTGVVTLTASDVGAIASTAKGAASGVAELDANGKVPASQLPSYVDDVLEYANQAAFPAEGEAGKIYVAKDTNLTYRWGGTGYVEISPSLALGTTSSTAYRGDLGDEAHGWSASSVQTVNINGTALTKSGNDGAKSVNIPIASTSALGVVKASTNDNTVNVNSTTGVMTVNDITTDKIVAGSNTLVLDCGNATI